MKTRRLQVSIPLAAAAVAALLSSCAAASGERSTAGATSPRAAPAANPTERILAGLNRLAVRDRLADPAAIEAELGLEGLAAGLTWEIPSDSSQGRRRAVFRSASETFPVRNVVIAERVAWGGFRGVPDGMYVHDDLTIVFRDGACPSFEAFEAAFGMKMEVSMALEPHAKGEVAYRTFDVPTDKGSQVRISVDPCRAFLASPSFEAAARPHRAVGEGRK